MFPNNWCKWTPVALSADVPAGTVIPAWTPTGDVALWRSQSGQLSASSDRCPHRGMRLSHGFVRGEALACIYHGWSYGRDGACLRIPAHPDLQPPASINTRNQITTEREGIVWVVNEAQDEPPPSFDGYWPLRSMTFQASIAALEAAAGAKADISGLIRCTLGGETAFLLAVTKGEAETIVHVLADKNASLAQRIAISQAGEQLRRDAESADALEGAN
ncbi:Rieske (2Fe-2S) protein [Rhizobium sp. L1K21]|uniref:Rieske (2Fe-2S) protein n=1 Tax=Rhizobium sp. L1K21 TaxID=2954933 RepID=UPI0020925DB7|nr:Rieske (2Fe-2S) protein [Rhizobium sp. L1K21]MCO6188375.1 Rieske (2Fe-2S) protein [Rhizobium sp. L1K21]